MELKPKAVGYVKRNLEYVVLNYMNEMYIQVLENE